MIINKNNIDRSKLEPLNLKNDKMIIDIETTGFSAKYSFIYMIGFLYYCDKENNYILEQWFSEKKSDEYEMLFRLNKKMEDKNHLISFNGDQFDIPFIKKRMALYNIDLIEHDSTDLLKRLRPYKKALALENLKLKTVEAYFDYKREDPFNGGDLIELYNIWLDRREENLLKTLLLHNYEDLLGLAFVFNNMPLINLLDHLKKEKIEITLETSGIENDYYTGTFKINGKFNITFNNDLFKLTLGDHEGTISLPTFVDHLKFYFDNPSDYYYLPNEDYAVHKSIGKFVHKDHRVKATKENCYIKKEDFFLPGYRHFDLKFPLYYKSSKDTIGYYSIEDLIKAVDGFDHYIQKLLTTL